MPMLADLTPVHTYEQLASLHENEGVRTYEHLTPPLHLRSVPDDPCSS
jgi:hypothetical protein